MQRRDWIDWRILGSKEAANKRPKIDGLRALLKTCTCVFWRYLRVARVNETRVGICTNVLLGCSWFGLFKLVKNAVMQLLLHFASQLLNRPWSCCLSSEFCNRNDASNRNSKCQIRCKCMQSRAQCIGMSRCKLKTESSKLNVATFALHASTKCDCCSGILARLQSCAARGSRMICVCNFVAFGILHVARSCQRKAPWVASEQRPKVKKHKSRDKNTHTQFG